MTKPASWYARRYVERFGMHLVPIEPRRKFPRSDDWGNNTLSDPDAADQYYDAHPEWNMGVALGPSRLCSLDIDNLESFRLICEVFGLDLDALIANTPTVLGRGYRLMFRVPADTVLPYRKLNWHSKNDPTGDKHRAAMAAALAAKEAGDTVRADRIRAVAKRWAIYTVFELRSATDGKQRQDVIPPSMHPDTGMPYRWHTQPRDEWPEPPVWLLAMWKDWDKFKPQLAAMCPWSVTPEAPEPRKSAPPRVQNNEHPGVIDRFLSSASLVSALDRYGYKQIGKRWLSPHSSTNLPGVVLFPDGNSCWIHHASDPLCSEESGHPVNAFDLFVYYEHGGDIRRAVKALAAEYRPAAVRHTPATVIDQDTGEVLSAPTAAPVMPASQPAGLTPCRDYVTPLPWATDKGKPLKHIDNLREICRRLGVHVRYNVISKEEEILIPGASFSMDNAANASLAWLASECSLFNFPTDKLGDFITYLADQNPFNPVAQWITSKPWDGHSRLRDLFATVTAANEDHDENAQKLKETLIKRWMISAVASALSPNGVSSAGVLVLQGAQYLGKTKWFKSLVPPELSLLKDGVLLRPDDKDSVKQACSYWLVELGELDATFRKADIAALKAFITKDSDVLRLAYAKRESRFARRTVFFGSVNPREFLSDPTGNRRYWTIECTALDHSHNLDMQQVWAEVYELWVGGEGFYLLPDEMDMLNSNNEDFTAIDPVEELISSRLDWTTPETLWRWEQATAVLIECGIERPNKADAATAAQHIRKLNRDRAKRTQGKRVLLVPPKRTGY